MKIPKGLTEETVLKVIDKVVDYLAPVFKFGYYDVDDMKQEGRLFCIEKIAKFDIDKSNTTTDVETALLNFFKRTVRNDYINLRRAKLTRAEPPCHACPFWDKQAAKAGEHDCKAFEIKTECDKWDGWLKRNVAKRSLMEPFDVSDARSEAEGAVRTKTSDEMVQNEVLHVLNTHMPVATRSDYRRYIDGVRLSKDRREKIIAEMRQVLCTHYSDEAAEWNFE